MSTQQPDRQSLYVPNRFEGLRDSGAGALRSIIVPIQDALTQIDERFTDMRSAGQGSLMILRGDTGAGKSTFLDTVGLFRQDVVTERVADDVEIADALRALAPSDAARILVLEGREALGEVSESSIESGMHAINSFVRSRAGRNSLVVWPANKDDLAEVLAGLASELGGESLTGLGSPVTPFSGPPPDEYVAIAERTVAALNQGASLAALGISEERAVALTEQADTVGQYLAHIRRELNSNQRQVQALMPNEQFRLWIVVVAGNDPEGDVAALTRGGYAYADIDRLMTATGANIVSDLRDYPDQLGILGTMLDAKILNLDIFTALAMAREYGDHDLHALMSAAKMSTARDRQAADRIASSELGLVISGGSLGTRRRGKKAGGSTKEAFQGLAEIARTNDALLNRALGNALVQGGYIDSFETERGLGTELVYRSDLYAVREGAPIRIEVMWRSKTSRAEIANYTLGKLANYARAMGLLT